MIKTAPNDVELDIVEELQLRRWARENYVPANRRDRSWHPIVHEEMLSRDAEAIINARSRQPLHAYVPLAPTAIQHLHRGHSNLNPPNVARQPEVDIQPEPSTEWIC